MWGRAYQRAPGTLVLLLRLLFAEGLHGALVAADDLDFLLGRRRGSQYHRLRHRIIAHVQLCWLALLLMILFGLLLVQAKDDTDLLLDAGYSDYVGDPLEDDLDLVHNEFELDQDVFTAETLPIVDDPFATPEITEITPTPVMPVGPMVPTTIAKT